MPQELERDARSPPSTPLKAQPRSDLAVSPPDEPGGASPAASELEPLAETELLRLAAPAQQRPASERAADTHRHVPWRDRARATLPATQQRDEDWPRSGPFILTGDLASAAMCKARAIAHLDAGEFPQAVTELETATSLAGPKDLELPVLLAQATAGATATRGLSPVERSAWSRVYGPDEPPQPRCADETMNFQKFADQNGARVSGFCFRLLVTLVR